MCAYILGEMGKMLCAVIQVLFKDIMKKYCTLTTEQYNKYIDLLKFETFSLVYSLEWVSVFHVVTHPTVLCVSMSTVPSEPGTGIEL